MELTQEYFDKGIANLLEKMNNVATGMATKEDLKDLEKRLRLGLVSKEDLKESLKFQTAELKSYVAQSFETQQVWIDERFGELVVRYDVRDRVEKLEKEVANLKLNKRAHA